MKLVLPNSLRQDEGAGGMSYEMSNMPSADDQNAITNEVSEIKFFLACVQRDEGGTTNLPEECDCNRPLYVSYEYTTNIHVSAQKGGCLIGSRGAGAQAEDMALVVAYNLKTGEVTALDANKFAIGRKCDTGWNVDWWLSLLDVTKSVMSYWVSTQGGTGAIPTQTQQDDFFDSLESLLSTSFSISTGSCGDIEDSRVLVSGDNTLSLIPNEPIRIALMSAYYVRTNGYGCYHSEAAVASDYFLLGVVESELTSDPECCADKFADYIVGSLSVPEEGDVEVNAINSIVGRQEDVSEHLASYGSWDDHPADPHCGCIILTYEYDLLRGPSCYNEEPYKQAPDNHAASIENPINVIRNVTADDIEVQLNMKARGTMNISIWDMSGRLVRNLGSKDLEIGLHNLSLPLNNLPSGSYILNCTISGNGYNIPIFIVN